MKGVVNVADYISREVAVALAEHAFNEWNLAMAAADGKRQINRCFKMQELCNAVASVFDNAPAADVAPVRRGRWAHRGVDEWCCPVFGFVITSEGSWDKPTKKYCEDCGARMDGKDGDGNG